MSAVQGPRPVRIAPFPNGELGVVAGSHRANVPALGITHVDLPRIALPTQTGDVTVHCSCTLHMSRPPVSAPRRVVWQNAGLRPSHDVAPIPISSERPTSSPLPP